MTSLDKTVILRSAKKTSKGTFGLAWAFKGVYDCMNGEHDKPRLA